MQPLTLTRRSTAEVGRHLASARYRTYYISALCTLLFPLGPPPLSAYRVIEGGSDSMCLQYGYLRTQIRMIIDVGMSDIPTTPPFVNKACLSGMLVSVGLYPHLRSPPSIVIGITKCLYPSLRPTVGSSPHIGRSMACSANNLHTSLPTSFWPPRF